MRCHYCGLPLPAGSRHNLCDLEASTTPLTTPLHSCPDSRTYPCDACNPLEAAS